MTLSTKKSNGCKKATLSQLKKEESKLSFFNHLMLLIHLAYCAACRRFVSQSKFINSTAYKYKEQLHKAPPYKLSEQVKILIELKISNSLNKPD